MPNQRQPNKAGGSKSVHNAKTYKPKSATRGSLVPKKNNNSAKNNKNNGKNGSR
jgi:hypothetical protein